MDTTVVLGIAVIHGWEFISHPFFITATIPDPQVRKLDKGGNFRHNCMVMKREKNQKGGKRMKRGNSIGISVKTLPETLREWVIRNRCGIEATDYSDPYEFDSTEGTILVPEIYLTDDGDAIKGMFVHMTDGDYEEWGLDPYLPDFEDRKTELVRKVAREIAEWLGISDYDVVPSDYGFTFIVEG